MNRHIDLFSVENLIDIIRELARQGDLPRDLGKVTLNSATKLEELGLDSLAKLILLSALDERRGIYIPDQMISTGMTLGYLADISNMYTSNRPNSVD
jgi:acyl carrier protein